MDLSFTGRFNSRGYSAVSGYHDLQPQLNSLALGFSSGIMSADHDANGSSWNVPCQNQIEQVGFSDPSMYWNTTTSVGSWHDPANMGGVYGTQIGDGLRLSLNKGVRSWCGRNLKMRGAWIREIMSACKISLLVLFSRLRNPVCTEKNLGSSSLSSTQLS
ncbi:hypothetical protein OIU74_003193 [Salix koriyanagi]|uniref:Uncharacterized protein n=1 Tax=Salix koriyanagi TaxID=2511006 RepID=A0A9Q0UYX0_9ROSI|nr:hypothetical protein OIU74_003193 [Salix koriyanagi]